MAARVFPPCRSLDWTHLRPDHPLDRHHLHSADATFLFETVSKRYEARKPIILTSNKSYGQWGEIFPDPVLATALLDRLLHHATAVNIRGERFRLRHRRQSGLPPAA